MFNENLKICRNNIKKTQKQVADEIGVTDRAYQYYEYGKREPNIEKLIALADYFDVSIDYLVGRSDDPKVNK